MSFQLPEYSVNTDGLGTLRLLNAIKDLPHPPKYYQASTSELFGGIPSTAPQCEQTPFYPKSPYAIAKLYAYWLTVNYRESYNLFAVNGILFNHESPRRSPDFITRKITKTVASIKNGTQSCLYLGNLNSKRDWGYAKEYASVMWRMLQHHTATDFIVATGVSYSIRQFCEFAFTYAGFDIEWQGEGLNEIAIDKKTQKILVAVDEKFFRPNEVNITLGNAKKIKKELGWTAKTHTPELVKIMMNYDLNN